MFKRKFVYFFLIFGAFYLLSMTPLHAQITPRCTINTGTYWSNFEVYISTNNGTPVPGSTALSNISTGSCGQGTNTALDSVDTNYTAPGYTSNYGQYLNSIGFYSPSTIFSGTHRPSGVGESIISGGNNTNSVKYLSFVQIFDCAFGYAKYNLSLPAGWEISSATYTDYQTGSTGQAFPGDEIPIFNPPAGSSYTAYPSAYTIVNINIQPIPPVVPTPTISASLSCNGISWNTSNFASGDKITGSINGTPNFSVPQQTSSSGTYNGFVLFAEKYNENYTGTLILHYGSSSVSTTTSSFNFSNCVSHPKPSCSGGDLSLCSPPPTPSCISYSHQLTVKGSLVAYGGVYSYRDLPQECDLYYPAVSVTFNPHFLSVYHELFIKNLGNVIQYWIEPGI